MIRGVFSKDCARSASISVTRVSVFCCIENVKNDPDQKGMAGLFPMGSAFEGPFRFDQDVSDVLNIAHFDRALTDLKQAFNWHKNRWQQRGTSRSVSTMRDRRCGSFSAVRQAPHRR